MKLPELKQQLTRQEVGGEVIFFDPQSQSAHCLNPLASRVASMCQEGLQRDVALEHLQVELDLEPEEAITILDNGLAVLQEQNLLANPRFQTNWDRRSVLKKSALVAVAPAILSIGLSVPASATSGLPVFTPCDSTAECCTGLICNAVAGECCVGTAADASVPRGVSCTSSAECCSQIIGNANSIICCPSGACGRNIGITAYATIDTLPPDPGVGNTVAAPRCCSGEAIRIAGEPYAANRLRCD